MSQALAEQLLTAASLHQKGEIESAEAIYRSIHEESPTNPDALHMLGVVAYQRQQYHDALGLIQHAIYLNPANLEYRANLARVWLALGRHHAAADALKGALEVDPTNAVIALDIARLLWEPRDVDATAHYARLAISLDPKRPLAHVMLAGALGQQGDPNGAIACYREALRLRPNWPAIRSRFIFSLQCREFADPLAISVEMWEFNRLHVLPAKRLIKPHPPRDPARKKLRIGWVSPDFRAHVVGRCILPVFHAFDREKFENYCYYSQSQSDEMTQQIGHSADAWRDISQLDDDAAAQTIRDDAPDVLVDLALHSGGGRPLILARKPAPIQVAYLGYPGSTGIETVDYRISNPRLDPPGSDLMAYTEKTVMLAGSYLCYRPTDRLAQPNPLPALTNGYITFGCLSNPTKISGRAIKLWSQIMREIPASRMILFVPSEVFRNRILTQFAHDGITPDRIGFHTVRNWSKYVETYNQIDLALDSFPITSGMTACDALWLGVPIVTLKGDNPLQRMCFSLLHDVGLPDLAADSPDQYRQIATRLAADLPRLSDLRSTLRGRIESSPVMNASAVARDLERIFLHICG